MRVLIRRVFSIAGVNAVLSIDAALGKVSPQLDPFLLPTDRSVPADLHLEILHQDAADGAAVPEPPGEMFMSAHPQQESLVFHRAEGRLIAGAGFTSCRAWDVRDFPPPDAFDARPWLLLALWGYLANRGGTLLHGALCELDGHFVLFLGRPGVGKSTLSRLAVAAGGTCLTEEYPLLTCPEEVAWAHGTPWRGIQGPSRRLSGRVEGVFFLHHAPSNGLQRLNQREGGLRLLQNARFFIWEPNTIPDSVEMLNRTARSTPIYDFGFVPDLSAVERLLEVL
jgi:hypothetical protein